MNTSMQKRILLLAVFFLAAVLIGLLVVALAGLPQTGTPATEPGTSSQATTTTHMTQQTTVVTTQPTTAVPTTAYVPVIYPDTVGIYIPAEDGTAARKRITEFSAKRTAKKDIDCFEILASRDALRPGYSFKGIWNDAWNAHENAEDTKIGLILTLNLKNGEVITKQILNPGDSQSFYDYLEVYLYDDIHQTGWYSHLEDKDMKEETMITSVKLTSGTKIAEVGDITLTAFLYNGQDCFDAQGDYIGRVSETIVIKEA